MAVAPAPESPVGPPNLEHILAFRPKGSEWRSGGAIVDATKASEIVPANRRRLALWIANYGLGDIFIGPDRGTNAAAGQANSGFPVFSKTVIFVDDFEGALWAVSASGNQDVRFAEFSWAGPFLGVVRILARLGIVRPQQGI